MLIPYRRQLLSLMPGGKRLPKMKRITQASVLPAHYQPRKGPSVVDQRWLTQLRNERKKEFSPVKGEQREGNLLFGDYRYWYGMNNPCSQWSKCRACNFSAIGVEARKRHFANTSCGRITTDAIKELDENFCVVCEKRTYTKFWGIPLCAQGCKSAWMFNDYRNFDLWKSAVAIVKLRASV